MLSLGWRERDEQEGKVLNWLVDICFKPHQLSWALGSDWKNKNMNQGAKRVSPTRWLCSALEIVWRAWNGAISMLPQEATPGQTQDMLERLHLSNGLKMPWYPLRGVCRSYCREKCLGFPAKVAAPVTHTWISRGRTSMSTLNPVFQNDNEICQQPL